MRRSLTVLTTSIVAAAGLAVSAQSAVADPDTAYADGYARASNGTGQATFTTDADRFGNLDVSATATGGQRFLVPILNLLPYSSQTSSESVAYVSDGIDGVQVEAGSRYRISITFSDIDVEESSTGNGLAVASVFGQAANGSDGAGHTLVAGAATEDVSEDGDTVLEFEAHPTQTGPIGVLSQVQVRTSAKGPGNEAAAELSATVTDVQIVEID